MLARAWRLYRRRGAGAVLSALKHRVVRRRAGSLAVAVEAVRGERRGLEIGGPSPNFGADGPLPLYAHIARLDNCNYATQTVWGEPLANGAPFSVEGRTTGRHHVAEATHLDGIEASSYDFVLSSHALEHSANPMAALREIVRVLVPTGTLVLVLPHRDGAFDHRRPVTTLSHLLDDERMGTTEADLTHLPEILELHDLSLDPLAGTREAFHARSLRNIENRCLHHHVFDLPLAAAMVDHVGLQIVAAEYLKPMDVIVIARKPAAAEAVSNGRFLG